MKATKSSSVEMQIRMILLDLGDGGVVIPQHNKTLFEPMHDLLLLRLSAKLGYGTPSHSR